MLRRFAFIETCLYWGDGITAQKLGDVFGITRPNAQACIKKFREKYPEAMRYNASNKRHEASDCFKPQCIEKEAHKYLDYLRGNYLTNHYWADDDWDHTHIEDVNQLFQPNLNRSIVRNIVSAIENKKTLSLRYHAKLDGHQSLTISPTHLVYASNRYHLRAYNFERERFIDLVLSRMLDIETIDKDWISSNEDQQWNTYENLSFIPNPELSQPVQDTLLLDMGLNQGEIHDVRTRCALKGYVRREMERTDWLQKIPLWVEIESL